jgi:hypothetical protein
MLLSFEKAKQTRLPAMKLPNDPRFKWKILRRLQKVRQIRRAVE